MTVVGYFTILLMGFTLGLLGGGGSILTVPILLYLFKMDAVTATAYSLFVVGLTSLFGAFGKWRNGEVEIPVGMSFAIPGFMGVFVSRGFIIPNLPEVLLTVGDLELTKDRLILVSFALIMLLASVSMIRGRKDSANTESKKAVINPLLISQGFILGLVTGFVGAGGGFLIVPALVMLAKLPMKKAVGTSLLVIAINSLVGFLGDVMTSSNIQWLFLLTLSALAIIGIFIGSHFARKVPDKKLKTGFGYFVLIMGLFILYQQT